MTLSLQTNKEQNTFKYFEQKPIALVFIAKNELINLLYELSNASWLPLIQEKFKVISINASSINTIKNKIAKIETNGRKIALVVILGHGSTDSLTLNSIAQSKLSIHSPSIEDIFPADRFQGSLILLSCKTGQNLAPFIREKCPHLTVTAPLEDLNTLYSVSYPCQLHKTCHFNFYNKDNNNITYTSNPCKTRPDFRFFKQSIINYIQQQNIFTASQLAYLIYSGFAPEKQEIFKSDPEKAELIAMDAAQKGREDAQTFLGILYLNQNKYEAAESWLLAASKKGREDAQTNLGHLYLHQGKQKKAAIWLLAASQKGHKDAQTYLGKLYIQQGKDSEAETWLLAASQKDHKNAQACLGALYFKQGKEKEAETWLLAASQKDHKNAQTQLGYLYLKQGKDSEAETWLLAAAKKGDEDAQDNLGYLYLQQGKDSEAETWLLLAAQKGHENAQSNLGYLYLKQGRDSEATPWLLAAAQKGHEEAQTHLGYLYLKQGRDAEAETWLVAAAQKGNEHARTNLKQLYLKQSRGKQIIVASVIENAETGNKTECVRKFPPDFPQSPQAKRSKQVSDS